MHKSQVVYLTHGQKTRTTIRPIKERPVKKQRTYRVLPLHRHRGHPFHLEHHPATKQNPPQASTAPLPSSRSSPAWVHRTSNPATSYPRHQPQDFLPMSRYDPCLARKQASNSRSLNDDPRLTCSQRGVPLGTWPPGELMGVPRSFCSRLLGLFAASRGLPDDDIVRGAVKEAS